MDQMYERASGVQERGILTPISEDPGTVAAVPPSLRHSPDPHEGQ